MNTIAETPHTAEGGSLALHEPQWGDIGQRVRSVRGTTSQEDFAKATQAHVNTIGKIERGAAVPTLELLMSIAKVGQVSPAWLMLGEPYPKDLDALHAIGPLQGVAPSVEAVEIGDYIYVPHFDIHVSAGPGSFHELESVKAMRPFDARYIRGELGISHNELAMCNVAGRSALPDLKPHDTILIDMRDRAVMNEGMHVVRLDGALILKLLQRLPGRLLRVSSRNKEEFASFDIAAFDNDDEAAHRDFEIIGRVRWGGVTFH